MKFSNSKGITLVSIIITIIVMLILSGVVTWVVNITLDKRKGENDNVSSDS